MELNPHRTIARSGGRANRRRAPALAVWIIAAILAGPVARAQDAPRPEYEVKAAFLYNFAKLTEWPRDAFAETRSPIVIGVLGDDPFGAVLDDTVRGKSIGDRPVKTVRFARADQVTGCHILFVSKSEQGRLAQVLEALEQRPILTVSDIDRFAHNGGMIGLPLRDEKVKVEINLRTVREAKLKLSSKLLRLQSIVLVESQ